VHDPRLSLPASKKEEPIMRNDTLIALYLATPRGDVLVGEATQRLVGDLVTLAPAGTFALKGRSEK
jgi:hypothetical protein